MPSIKKRVTGFIRQLSAPNAGGTNHHHHHHHEENGHHQVKGSKSHPGPGGKVKGNTRRNHGGGESAGAGPTDSVGFIQKYFQNGALHEPGPAILSGKTGQDLPAHRLSPASLDPEVFAAFTGPEGGITSICSNAGSSGQGGGAGTRNKFREDAAEESEDFDYIDLEDLNNPIARRNSRKNGQPNPVINSSDKENKIPNDKNSSSSSRSRRELSVESDYPELGGDFNFGGLSNNSPPLPGSNQKSSSSKTSNASSIYANQMILCRRLKLDLRNDTETAIAGIRHWYRPNNAATGQAVTLYERHPFTAEHAGNPIADTFSVVARKNSAILVLGDGVNWGAKAALASRCAVSGCMEYLNTALFSTPSKSGATMTTQEVFQILLRSFNAAHSLILQEEAQLTTLTACIVIPVKVDGQDEEKFVACACNVGDSLAYVYSPSSGHVREITQDSHDITSNRDMRDALGALGPVDGINPELSNLTYSMTFVEPTDIVFITSDGVSDNFDPVVGKFCVPLKSDGRRAPVSLPAVEAYQRHDLTLLRMEDILNHGSGSASSQSIPSSASSSSVSSSSGRVRTSAELCHRMVDFCQRLTTAKRKILEDPELYPDHTRHALPDSDATRLDQKMRRRKVCEKLAMVPGKLDHATIVAYTVDDRRKSLQQYRGTVSSPILDGQSETNASVPTDPSAAAATLPSSSVVPLTSVGGSLRAPCASTEDLTLKDDLSEDGRNGGEDEVEDGTPTPSVSLCSSNPSLNCGSLAVTPIHHPKQDIDLCFKGNSGKAA